MHLRKLANVLFAATLAVLPVAASAQPQDGAKQDMKNAGSDTKSATKSAGRGVKTGTKKAYNKTKHGTKKAYHQVDGNPATK